MLNSAGKASPVEQTVPGSVGNESFGKTLVSRTSNLTSLANHAGGLDVRRLKPNPKWSGRTSWKRKAQSLGCQVRKHCGDKEQGKNISVEVMDMHRINYGLGCHDQPVRDA